MAMIILHPNTYSNSCISGLKLWVFIVLPSSLPFFFLTTLFTQTGTLITLSQKLNKLSFTLFKQKGICFYAFLMSVLSGYPVGSRICYDLYTQGLINNHEAEKLSLLSSTSGPIFVIGAVGVTMFKSTLIGAILFLTHILSAIIVGVLVRNHGKTKALPNALLYPQKVNNILYDSVYQSVISSLVVGGFISIFYVIADIVKHTNLLYPIEFVFSKILLVFGENPKLANSFLIGIIECTRGCRDLSTLPISPLIVALTGTLISFGGISIIMQSLAFLKGAKVKVLFFLKGKLLHALLTFILAFLFSFLFL